MTEAEYTSRSRALLDSAGLTPFADRPAGALSGGMRQKLAISNALLPTPQLLILDEPTAGVDVVARAELWSILEEVKRSALVVVSTSYVDEVAACDTLAYLDRGRLVATGSPEALRATTPLELYRAWGEDPRAIARASRKLPFVYGARAAGRYARVEVRRDRSPGGAAVSRALRELDGARVTLAEQREPDMESTLLAFSELA
jgi:ABC-type multidrug transport system ATPase subunit